MGLSFFCVRHAGFTFYCEMAGLLVKAACFLLETAGLITISVGLCVEPAGL